MIETLTPEQEALIPVIRDEWINRLDSCPKIDREAAISGMKWCYNLVGLKEPQVVILDSPMSAIIFYSILKNGAESVEAALEIMKEFSIEDILSGKRKLKMHSPEWASFGRIDDFGWTSFYDYWERCGVDLNCPHWENWKRFVRSGLFSSIQLVGVAIICSMPLYLKRSKSGPELHSEDGPAIEWADGYKLYRLWGVHFGEDLYCSIVGKTISQADVFKIENQEQRYAALRFLGAEYVLTTTNSKLIDSSSKDDELYEVTGIIDEIIYCVKYKCPSTARVYVDFVSPDVGEKRDVTLAMASKGRLTKFQLENCVINHT